MTIEKIRTDLPPALTDYVREPSRECFAWSVLSKHHQPVTERWANDVIRSRSFNAANIRMAEWSVECAIAGAALMSECVVVDPEIRSGRLVLKDTGFTVAQTLVELADSSGVDEVADEFDLDAETIRALLNGLSLLFERSWSKRP